MEDNKVSISKNGLLLTSIILLVSFFVGFKVYQHHIKIETNNQQKIDSLEFHHAEPQKEVSLQNIDSISSAISVIEPGTKEETNSHEKSTNQKIEITVNVEKEQVKNEVKPKVISSEEVEEQPKKKEKVFGAAIIGTNSNSQVQEVDQENISIPFIPVRVHGNQEIKNGSTLYLELASNINIGKYKLKKGTIISSQATLDQNRIFVSFGSIEAIKGELEGPFDLYGSDKIRGVSFSNTHALRKTVYVNDGLNYYVK